MVARVCAAFAGDDAKENIGGLALFGDPFNGATVKGISQQDIRTWCDPGDAVCSGEEVISAAHLAYQRPGNPSIPQAVQWMRELVSDEED
jgi:Cutinase